jgi:hypothetical protein
VCVFGRPVVVFSSGVERNETVFGLLRVLLSNVSRSGDGIVESRLKTGNGASTEDKDERRVRRIRCDGDRVVNDCGVGAGVAMLSDDGGPLLVNDGVVERPNVSCPAGGADAVRKRGTDDARTVEVPRGVGRSDSNHERQALGAV